MYNFILNKTSLHSIYLLCCDCRTFIFIQQLDDITFTIARKDILDKETQRARTEKYFQTKFEQQIVGRSKKMGIFLKAAYFINMVGLLVGMTVIYKLS